MSSLSELLKKCVLRPEEERFTLDGRAFIIKEASAGAVAQWRDFQFSRTKMSQDGRIESMGGLSESDLFLLSLCLWEEYTDNSQAKTRAVPYQELRTWPNGATSHLIDWVKERSNLNPQDEAAVAANGATAKNLPVATTEPSA